jgi:hypothetical protein
VRRIGMLSGLAADDPEGQARFAAFAQGLQQLGWTDGRNVRIDIRSAAGNVDDARTRSCYVAEVPLASLRIASKQHRYSITSSAWDLHSLWS